MEKDITSRLKFDSNGLIPAIIQDARNGEVLMMAWMNEEAVRMTVETGFTHFFSRSRRKLWKKGETSGHVQRVMEVYYDCDADCLLIKAEQIVAACHTGHRSCFHNTLDGALKGAAVFDPQKVYRKVENGEILSRLFEVILERKKNPGKDSYTSALLAGGAAVTGGKVLEEAKELTDAAAGGEPEATIREAADLVYHTMVLLAGAGVSPGQVKEELARRFGKSGIQEKMEREKK